MSDKEFYYQFIYYLIKRFDIEKEGNFHNYAGSVKGLWVEISTWPSIVIRVSHGPSSYILIGVRAVKYLSEKLGYYES
jgi:hypothetical protein